METRGGGGRKAIGTMVRARRGVGVLSYCAEAVRGGSRGAARLVAN